MALRPRGGVEHDNSVARAARRRHRATARDCADAARPGRGRDSSLRATAHRQLVVLPALVYGIGPMGTIRTGGALALAVSVVHAAVGERARRVDLRTCVSGDIRLSCVD